MKMRTQILSALFSGAILVGQGGVVYANTPTEPVDEVPGEFRIERINPGDNSLTVTYEDTGTDIDQVLRLTVAYVREGFDYDDRNWIKVTYPFFMGQIYDKATRDDNSAQLLSGQTEVINNTQMIDNVMNDTRHKLYYGGATALTGNPNVVRNIIGIVKYEKCMEMYEAGVECVREVNEFDEVVYAPYKNGEAMAVTWAKGDGMRVDGVIEDEVSGGEGGESGGSETGNGDGEHGNGEGSGSESGNGGENESGNGGNSENNGNGNGGNGESENGGGEGGENAGDVGKSENNGGVIENGDASTDGGGSEGNGTSGGTESGGTSDGGVGSSEASDGAGNGEFSAGETVGNGENTTNWVENYWTGTSDPGNSYEFNEQGGQEITASYLNNDNNALSNNSNEQVQNDQAGNGGDGNGGMKVPALSGEGENKENGKMGSYVPWLVVAMAVLGSAGLGFWWMLPTIKKVLVREKNER